MGIYNRDYYRQSGGGPGRFRSGSGGTTSISQRLLIANIIVFLMQVFLQVPTPTWRLGLDYVSATERATLLEHADELDREAYLTREVSYISIVEKWGAVAPRAVQRGEIWRLVTYAFLHSQEQYFHIIFNMMALWSFGPLMEELWGRREFLAFYLAAAIFAGICHVFLAIATNVPNAAVGASGAIMGLLMAFAVYFPRHTVMVFIFQLEAQYLVMLYVLFDLIPVLQMLGGGGQGRGAGVAHAAHLGGLAFGYLYCMMGWKLTGWMDQFLPSSARSRLVRSSPPRSMGFVTWLKRLVQKRPDLKIHEEPAQPTRPGANPQSQDSRVDAVLKKISEVGEANITEAERDILREAARRYRDKN